MSENLTEQEIKELERRVRYAYENYICEPDVYKYAYENSKEFRRYINSLPEERMEKIKRAHAALSVSNGVHNLRKGMIHASTFGLSFLAEKALFKSKKQKIIEIVESEEFATLFNNLYILGL